MRPCGDAPGRPAKPPTPGRSSWPGRRSKSLRTSRGGLAPRLDNRAITSFEGCRPIDRGDMHLGQQAVKARVAPGLSKGVWSMARPRVAIWALVALVAGAVALVPLHGGVKTADAAAIAFETPTLVDPIHTNGEPDIAIDPQGRAFHNGPPPTATQRSTWFGSVDGGHTFRVMTQKIPASPAVGIPAPGPGGGDTDIAFDRSGKQYFADLLALACQRVGVTGPTKPGPTGPENLPGCALSRP